MSLKFKFLSTRAKAKQIAQSAEEEGRQEIDLTGVEFVSRAFADEIVTQAEDRNLHIVGVSDDVAEMLAVIRRK